MVATTIEHDAQDGGRGVGHELEKLPTPQTPQVAGKSWSRYLG